MVQDDRGRQELVYDLVTASREHLARVGADLLSLRQLGAEAAKVGGR